MIQKFSRHSLAMKNFRNLIIPTLVSCFLCGCPALNSGGGVYYPDSRYDRPYYGGRYDYENERERERLERERDRLERERERLEREREDLIEERKEKPPKKKKPKKDRCPSGWVPSERRCSSSERKRGCQDMRTPGGLGCVRGRS